jgi:valyl-tRNA synthetase
VTGGPGPDVLDTWFSSALWPFSTLGWPEETPDLQRFYPNGMLVTGYDILFFWVVRMMMFGLYAMDGVPPVPRRRAARHGPRRARQEDVEVGRNVVDPLQWMDAYGTDALRFTFARGANPGADVPIGEDAVQGSRNFCNKLWNATRFALLNGATVAGGLPDAASMTAADRWVLSRLQAVTAEVDRSYEDFQFARATELLYHFAWDELCDWYLELAKVPLSGGGAPADVTRAVLGHVLDALLRLLHPVIPFVTETLWTALTGRESAVVAEWPRPDASLLDSGAEAEIAAVQRLVTEVRRFRTEQGLADRQKVPARIAGIEASTLQAHEQSVRALTALTVPGDEFTATASLPTEGVVGGAGSRGCHRRDCGAPPARSRPRRGREGPRPVGGQAGQRAVHGQGPRSGGRQGAGPARLRGRRPGPYRGAARGAAAERP